MVRAEIHGAAEDRHSALAADDLAFQEKGNECESRLN